MGVLLLHKVFLVFVWMLACFVLVQGDSDKVRDSNETITIEQFFEEDFYIDSSYIDTSYYYPVEMPIKQHYKNLDIRKDTIFISNDPIQEISNVSNTTHFTVKSCTLKLKVSNTGIRQTPKMRIEQMLVDVPKGVVGKWTWREYNKYDNWRVTDSQLHNVTVDLTPENTQAGMWVEADMTRMCRNMLHMKKYKLYLSMDLDGLPIPKIKKYSYEWIQFWGIKELDKTKKPRIIWQLEPYNASESFCGDGYISPGEECDLGNQTNSCCQNCKIQQGCLCQDEPSQCECLKDYYQPPNTNQCIKCFQGCATCTSSNYDGCTSCINNFIFTGDINQTKNTCKACHESCISCDKEYSATNCDRCVDYYADEMNCSKCIEGYKKEKVGNFSDIMLCQAICQDPLLYQDGECVCAAQSYREGFKCLPCDESCKNCIGSGSDQCVSCQSSNALKDDCSKCIFGYHRVGESCEDWLKKDLLYIGFALVVLILAGRWYRKKQQQKKLSVQIGDNVYQYIKQIGKGGQGVAKLYQCQNDKKKYVIKSVNLNDTDQESYKQAMREVRNLEKLEHNYVVKMKESKVEARQLLIVLEYANAGDLKDFINKHKLKNCHKVKNARENISEIQRIIQENSQIHQTRMGPQSKSNIKKQVLEIMIQICQGVDYMHENAFIHRDLKPQNVFLFSASLGFGIEQIVAKVGDLGTTKQLDGFTSARTKVATVKYAPPEYFTQRKVDANYDTWSLGVILFQLLTLEAPFQNKEMIRKINFNAFLIQDENLRTIIENIFQKRPSNRPRISEIIVSLQQILWKMDGQNMQEKQIDIDNSDDEDFNFQQNKSRTNTVETFNIEKPLLSDVSITSSRRQTQR